MESHGESQCHLGGGESVWRKNHHNNGKRKEEVSILSIPLITMNILFLPCGLSMSRSMIYWQMAYFVLDFFFSYQVQLFLFSWGLGFRFFSSLSGVWTLFIRCSQGSSTWRSLMTLWILKWDHPFITDFNYCKDTSCLLIMFILTLFSVYR